MRNKKWWVLLGTGIAGTIIAIDFSIVNTSLTPIQQELHASITELQWIINGFGLFFVGFLVTSGRLSDLKGRRKFLYTSMIGFALASLGAGLAQSPGFLIAMRMLQGFTCSAIFPSGMAITARAFPEHQQNRALSIYGSLIGIGLAFGPVVGGLIVTIASWRWIFFINLPVILISFAICLFVIEESKQSQAPPVDWIGVISMVLCISGLLFVINESQTYGWLSMPVIIAAIVFITALVVFIVTEKRIAAPIIPFELLLNKGFLLGTITFVTGVSLSWAIIFIMPLYLHDSLGFTTGSVGLTLFAMTIMTVITPAIAGHYYNLKGEKVVAHTLFFISVISLALFTQLQTHGPLWLILITFILFGSAWGISSGISVPLGLSRLPDVENSGLVSGVMLTLMNLGGVIALALSTAFFNYGKQVSLVHAVHLVATFLIIIAIILWVIATVVLGVTKRNV
ncbi:MAG: MFS transporter [Pseudomonadota bacterium]